MDFDKQLQRSANQTKSWKDRIIGGFGLTPNKNDVELEDEQARDYVDNAEEANEQDRRMLEQWQQKPLRLSGHEWEERRKRYIDHIGRGPRST